MIKSSLTSKRFIINNLKTHHLIVLGDDIIKQWEADTTAQILSWLQSSKEGGYFCDDCVQKHLLFQLARLDRLNRLMKGMQDKGTLFKKY